MMTGYGVNDCTESIEFLINHTPTRNANCNNTCFKRTLLSILLRSRKIVAFNIHTITSININLTPIFYFGFPASAR